MLPLVVHIERSHDGKRQRSTRAFHESPVRIGRSPFANLRLREPFVSEWQAVVRFHGERTTYLDLGSRNPTQIRGQVIERNVEVEVDATTDVCIGNLRLRFERVACAPLEPASEPEEDTAFITGQQLAKDRPTGTVLLQNTPLTQAPKGAAPPPLPGRRATVVGMNVGGAGKAGPATSAPQPSAAVKPARIPEPMQAEGALLAAQRNFEFAQRAWLEALRYDVEAAPANKRVERVWNLRARFPYLAQELSFRELAQNSGVDPLQLGYVDVDHWLCRLCSVPNGTFRPEQLGPTMERTGQLLETFASAFIEARRAHERARKKLGLEKGATPATTLQKSEDPHAVLAYMLGPTAHAQDRSRELRRSLGDFAMHQIALLSAVVEGARSMLGQLSPRALHDAPEPRDAAAVLDHEGALGQVWPHKARKLWRKFLVRHNDLTQTDHFARELFGHEFTRRYHAIADAATNVEVSPAPAHRAAKVESV